VHPSSYSNGGELAGWRARKGIRSSGTFSGTLANAGAVLVEVLTPGLRLSLPPDPTHTTTRGWGRGGATA